MPLAFDPRPSPPPSKRPLPAVLLGCALFGALALGPWAARADELCTRKCSQRQATCATSCGRGDKCRQHCNESADSCFSHCQKSDDARETAQQRRADKPCFGNDGRMRKCTAAEAEQIREGTEKSSKLLCRAKNGELTACPDQAKQLEDAKQFIPKECTETGCKADTSN